MPLVQITMLEGYTADRKRELARRITDALFEEGGAGSEAIIVATKSRKKATPRAAN